jgi:hypothetical protein
LLHACDAFPLRIFVIDNSGSMGTPDGHRLVHDSTGRAKMLPCSRWEELLDALSWHAKVAAGLGAPTEFRLLNPTQYGEKLLRFGFSNDEETQSFTRRLGDPRGQTPLCAEIQQVVRQIEELAPALRAAGQRVVLHIASDGEASDGRISEQMAPLRNLPVWVVVRLCTDSDEVVSYWNNVDEELELEMDVLDDLAGEAKEVYEQNPWMCYATPMHRLREWGSPQKVLDLMDERPLNGSEICKMAGLIYGPGPADDLPNPDIDFKAFEAALIALMQQYEEVYCPVRNKIKPWFSVNKLRRKYGRFGGCAVQ